MTLLSLKLSGDYGRVTGQIKGEGIPLVLVHGVGMQSAAWEPQINALSSSHTIITIDLPGHGGSDPLKAGAMLPDYVEWLKAVLERLGLGKICLAGHSMGALIAAGMAVEYSHHIGRLALLNGVFRRSPDAKAAVLKRATELRTGRFDLDTPLNRWFGNGEKEQQARQQVAGWLSEVCLKGYATAYHAFACGDALYADRFHEIGCPFLALTGEEDRNSTPLMSRAMAQAVPFGRCVVIEGHRHMVNLTAPDAVNRALREWLDMPAGKGSDDKN